MTHCQGEEILRREEITLRPAKLPLPDSYFERTSGGIGIWAETANLHNRRDKNG